MHLICLLSSHFISSYFQTKIVTSAIPDATRNIVSQFHGYTLRRILEKAFFSVFTPYRIDVSVRSTHAKRMDTIGAHAPNKKGDNLAHAHNNATQVRACAQRIKMFTHLNYIFCISHLLVFYLLNRVMFVRNSL